MGDDDAGEAGGAQGTFEPLDAFEVEVVGGLVEQQDVGLGDHGLGDGEALAPAAAEGVGVGVHADGGVGTVVGEAGAAEGLAEALLVLVLSGTPARFRAASRTLRTVSPWAYSEICLT